MSEAVSLEQVREETDNDPVLSKVNQLLRDHEQDTLDKVWGTRGYCHTCHTVLLQRPQDILQEEGYLAKAIKPSSTHRPMQWQIGWSR